MPLQNFLPTLPWPLLDTVLATVGLLGAILLIYGVYLEAERRQDAVFVIGSAGLFVYALWIGSTIFMIAMGAMFLAAGRELIQIARGKHAHSAKS